MSIRLILSAFDAKVGNSNQKLVLIKLCDNSNDEGICWPSYSTIAQATELSRRTVMRCITELEKKGFLTIKRRKLAQDKNASNVYKISFSGDTQTLGSDTQTLGGSVTQSPEPVSIEPVNESINVDSNESTTYDSDLVKKAFNHFWANWKQIKKDIGKTDTSPKTATLEKKWKPIFNQAYFKRNTLKQFKDEVNQVVDFCKKAHAVEGFNRFENMQAAKFLNEKQWRDQ